MKNTESDSTCWGIHAGRTGDAHSLFLENNIIALGFAEFGNALKVDKSRDAFKAKFMEVRPGRKDGYYPIAAGQVYRYVYEAQKGDYAIYPSKIDKMIHIGEITGDYVFKPTVEQSYPHHRSVKWLKTLPRTAFSQGALYETGSAMSFFQVKNYAEEFISAIHGKIATPEATKDESVSLISEDTEQNTRDFILKILAQELKGHPLAEFVAHLLSTMGYRTRVSPEGPDGGIDILAHKDELGFEPPIIKVQVKSSEGSIGDAIVSQLYGKVDKSEYGMVVTLGSFTNPAVAFARNKSNLRLIDGDELIDLVLQHYEQFDSKYKGLLPMKRIYVPEPLDEED